MNYGQRIYNCLATIRSTETRQDCAEIAAEADAEIANLRLLCAEIDRLRAELAAEREKISTTARGGRARTVREAVRGGGKGVAQQQYLGFPTVRGTDSWGLKQLDRYRARHHDFRRHQNTMLLPRLH